MVSLGFKVRALATLVLLQIHLIAADASTVFKCPCKFTVSRQVDETSATDSEAFDVIVEDIKTPRPGFISRSEEHSRTNLKLHSASHTDSVFHYYHNLHIEDAGAYRVTVRHHGASKTAPQYLIQARQTSRQLICPVLIPQHPPVGRQVIGPAEDQIATGRQSPLVELPPSPKNKAINHDPLIAGGLLVSSSLLPYLVAIETPRDSCTENPCRVTRCTGTLISSRWVITAAHCQVKTSSRVFVSTPLGDRGRSTQPLQIINHPKYRVGPTGLPHDIAVIKLASSVADCCTPKPQFMELNFNASLPIAGSFVRVAGFGRISHDNSIPDPGLNALRQVDVPIANQKRCRRNYKELAVPLTLKKKFQMCSGYLREGGCDACFGDSGGPVMQYDGDKPILLSVVSVGVQCGRFDFPGVSVRLSGHQRWLESTPAEFTVHSGTLDSRTVRCEAGEFLQHKRGEIAQCTPCPDEGFSFPTMRACFRCDGSLRRDTFRGNKCSCRRREGYGFTGDSTCTICPPGMFSNFGRNKCKRCPANTFSDTPGSSSCKACPGARRASTSCSFDMTPEPLLPTPDE